MGSEGGPLVLTWVTMGSGLRNWTHPQCLSKRLTQAQFDLIWRYVCLCTHCSRAGVEETWRDPWCDIHPLGTPSIHLLQFNWLGGKVPSERSVCIVTCLCTSVYYVYMRRALYCMFTCWHTSKYTCLHNCMWVIYMHLNKILPSKTCQYKCIHLNTRYTCGPRSACMVVLYVSHVSATTSVNKSRLVETGGGV